MATKTWNVTTAGNADWATAANWTGGVPTNVDLAEVTSSLTTASTVVVGFGTAQALTLNIDRTNNVLVSNATLAVGGTIRVGRALGGADLLVSSFGTITAIAVLVGADVGGALSTLRIDGPLSSLSTTSISVGLAAAGDLTVKSGGTITVNGGAGTLGIGGPIATGRLLFGDGSTAGTINAASVDFGNANSSIVFNQTDAHTFGPLITGSGFVTVTGSGVLTFDDAHSYSGTTTIDSGSTLVIGAGGTTGSIFNSAVVNNGTLTFNRSDAASHGTVISGSGALNKQGSGTLSLSAANSYSGITTVSAGTLALDSSTGLGASGVNNPANGTVVLSGATLELRSNVNVSTEALTLSGSGASSAGALRGNGIVSYAGAITLAASSEISTTSAASSALLLTGAISGTNQTLTIDGAGDTTISGAISLGNGGLIKSGTGDLLLSAANSYSGETTVAGGLVEISNNSALGSAGVFLDANTILRGSSVFNVANNIRLNGNATLDTASSFVAAGVISGPGTLIKTGTGNLSLSGANTYSGGTSFTAGIINLNGSNQALGTGTVTMTGGTTLQNGNLGNITLANNLVLNGGQQIFSGSGGTTLTLNGAISGTGKMRVFANVTLNAANSFSGGVEIGAFGNVTLGNIGGLGSGAVTFSGSNSSLRSNVTGTLTNNYANEEGDSFALAAAAGQTLTLTGNLTLNAVSANTTLGFGATTADTGTVVFAPVATGISGPNAGLVVNAGTLKLGSSTGSSTLAGLNSAIVGTSATLATLDLAGNSPTLNNLSGSSGGRITSSAGSSTILTAVNTVQSTFAGAIQDSGVNQVRLNKDGAGTLNLSGVNTHTGLTQVLGGKLALTGGGRLENASITMFNGAVFDITNNSAAIVNVRSLSTGSGGGDILIGGKIFNITGALFANLAGNYVGSAGVEALNITTAIAVLNASALTFQGWTDGVDLVFLNGNGLANTIPGTTMSDRIDGKAGADAMIGGLGNDEYAVDNAGDAVTEFAGQGTADTVIYAIGGLVLPNNVEIGRLAGAAVSLFGKNSLTDADILVANQSLASVIDGQAGNDEIFGSAFADVLNGNLGDDILRSQGGADQLFGGDGNDQFVISNAGAVITEGSGVGSGIDTVWLEVNDYVMAANIEIARLAAPGAFRVFGNDGDQDIVANQGEASVIDGLGGDDTLWGSSFADTLNGNTGNDILRSQGGADQLFGGDGNDHFVVFNAGAVITEGNGASSGSDTAWVALAANTAYTVGANVETINLADLATVVTGNDQDNVVAGNPLFASNLNGAGGNDTIFGSSFADLFFGGNGNDILYSQGGADIFRYSSGFGFDQISGFVLGQARIDFSGMGLSFGSLVFQFGGGNTQVVVGQDKILVYGVTSMNAADFIF